jgi:murein DD-endopeptidase MepM/ murein hydrolase activator NlpD
LLFGLLMGSLSFNVVVGIRLLKGSSANQALTGTLSSAEQPILAIGEQPDLSYAPLPPDQVPPLPTPKRGGAGLGLITFAGSVSTSLSASIAKVEGTSPAALTAVFSRLFAWDVDLRRDIHRGDLLAMVFEQAGKNEPKILAARLVLKAPQKQDQQKSDRVLTAFRYQAPGDAYASYWTAEGREVPRRLVSGPLSSYEQIATLFRDRPSHLGMDFKVNIGTPVMSPRAGVVTRVDFDKVTNGNCVEIRYPDGVLASFLHLNETLVKPGQKITGGSIIGKSGNSGRSPGAHLHYQLMSGSKALDPMQYHGSLQRELQPEAMAEFLRVVKELTIQLDNAANPETPAP